MAELLVDQAESDKAYRRWTTALLSGCSEHGSGWIIEGRGVFFSNYGHGEPGTILNQVMLGADLKFGNGVVKIVQPDTSQRDKGKLTVIGRTVEGRLILLREGWLKKNRLSREIRSDFVSLSDLQPVPVFVSGNKSNRNWFFVADLSGETKEIIDQTAQFALACARARSKAGGSKISPVEESPYSLGLDEKGRLFKVLYQGGTAEICALQGFIWEELKEKFGSRLTKPKNGGFEVDGFIGDLNLLIEIKTGTSAANIYEAIGQLRLYPSLTGLNHAVKRVLLIPSESPLNPLLATALQTEGVEIYTYSVGAFRRKPQIKLSPKFLQRCAK